MKKINQRLGKFHNTKSTALKVGAASLGLCASVANAALPTGVTTLFDGIIADATSVFDMGWPLMLLITGTLITIGLVRKVAKTMAR